MSATPWEALRISSDAWSALPLPFRIGSALAPYWGWGYDLGSPKIAYQTPSVPPALLARDAASRVTNCSTLTASLVTACFPLAGWSSADYGDLQVFADRLPGRPDAPVLAVERKRVGRIVQGWVPGAYHLVQTWRSLPPAKPAGHALIVLARSAGDLMVIEATSRPPAGVRVSIETIAAFAERAPAALFLAALG